MRLKYYLRGIGTGIFVTTVLFMILISVNQNNGPSQQVSNDNEQSKTIADFENHAQDGTDAEQGAQPEAGQPADDAQPEADDAQPEADDAQPEADDAQPEADDAQPEADDAQPEADQPADAQPKSRKKGKVRFIISGGEYSDVICRKLAEAGLVDDADAYNKFLVEENYDNFINPGVYDIPKDATYEEIAVLLTTKVE